MVRICFVLFTCKIRLKQLLNDQKVIKIDLFPVMIAFVLPHLDLIISLNGAICISVLIFIYPAIFEFATYWRFTNNQCLLLVRTLSSIAFGLSAACFGSYKSISDLTRK